MKKLISSILIVCMLMSLVHIPTTAVEEVAISSAEQLVGFAERVNNGEINLNAKLTADIDLSSICGEELASWTPIGNSTNKYNGSFNGNSHSISGLYISSLSEDYMGLFGYVLDNADIYDLVVSGDVSGNYTGAIAGYNRGTITNVVSRVGVVAMIEGGGIAAMNFGSVNDCVNYADILTDNGTVGGIIGISNAGSVSGCINSGSVSSGMAGNYSSYIGGIVGENEYSTIKDSVNTGDITGLERVGGIAGYSYSVISGCSNYGTITSTGNSGVSRVGGIVGFTRQNVENSFNAGSIVATAEVAGNYAGGIAGHTNAAVTGSKNVGTVEGKNYIGGICGNNTIGITNSENAGKISGVEYTGGIVGYFSSTSATIENCHNSGEVYSSSNRAGGIAGYGETTSGGPVTIKKCSNSGSISVGSDRVGGIVGDNECASGADNFIIDQCSNSGTISGATANGAGNFAAGITGVIKGTITNCYNTGNVTGNETVGGVVGLVMGEIDNCFNYATNTSVYKYTTTDAVIGSNYQLGTTYTADMFANGDILTSLYTATADVWKQGELYPIFAYITEEVAQGTAEVRNAEDLIAALADDSVETIILKNNINTTEDISVDRSVSITGGYMLSCNKLSINADTFITDICVECTTDNMFVNNAALSLDGNVFIFASSDVGIIATNGTVTENGNALCSAPCLVSLDQASAFVSEKDYEIHQSSMFTDYYTIIKEDLDQEDVSFIIKAENNTDLAFDVYPYLRGNSLYFFMPARADITTVTYTRINNADNSSEDITISTEQSNSVTINNITYNIEVMQSELPTLFINIDETYGTIDEMNSSPDHEKLAYGDMLLESSDSVAEANGWKTKYTSVENDEDEPCTMEIRGRGNSTWSTTLGVKKPYQFKLEKKTDLLGMGKAKTWVLVYDDQDIIRHKLGLELGAAMGLNYNPDSQFVDVYMNGEFLGNYLLAEKVQINEERVDITNLEDAFDESEGGEVDLTGGYLMEIDNWSGDTICAKINDSLISIKEPENLGDSIADENYSYIADRLNTIFASIYSEKPSEYLPEYFRYIDIESFVTYYWHQEYLQNFDAGVGSTYMYKDSDLVDPIIYAGPIWDSDNIFCDSATAWYANERLRTGTDTPTIFNQLMKRKEFVSYAIYYYEQKNFKSIFDEYTDKIDEYYELVKDSAEMDSARWGFPVLTVSDCKEFMRTRATWIDANYTSLMQRATIGNEIDVENPPALRPTKPSAEIADGMVNASVMIDAEKQDSTMIIAQYDADGGLIKLDMSTVEGLCGAEYCTAAQLAENAADVSVFMWKDLASATPIAEKITM